MKFERPVLQLALDFISFDRALKVAEEAVRGGVDWIEAGTPLIKSEGIEAVRRLKKSFKEHTILADMKTVDTGAIEVEMAARAGADVVILLGTADEITVREAVEAGRRLGSKIMVDLLGVENATKRALQLENLGVDYICAHTGIDQQMRGVDPLKVLREVVEAVHVPVAVAGGINSETAASAVEMGASIVIVGGAITKAANAERAAAAIKRAMVSRKPLPTKHYKKYGESDLVRVFREVSTPNISDALQRKGEMRGIKPIVEGVKAVGKAVTVRTYPGDWAKPIEAIDIADPQSVIVIDAGGGMEAVWGELATLSCIKRGLSGVVIDGGIRDVDAIRELKFPAFARHINPTAGEPRGLGEINVEVTCGGIKVRPGDWIIGDENGIVVVSAEAAVEVANRAEDVFEKEIRIREEIKRGCTLSGILQLKRWEKDLG
ncbi:MAG: 3-hexulose-6-phosphate synthase [Candidatus Bathyarchaeia archaeon]